MNGDITFRKAVVGGFNREDVMNYISSMATTNNEQQKLRIALRESQATVEKLQAELEAKDDIDVAAQVDNGEIEKLNEALAESELKIAELKTEIEAKDNELETLRNRLQQFESKTTEFDDTAEKLMRDSMVYADRYVESANLMAGNVRKETLAKVKTADAKVIEMIEKATVFCKEADDFKAMLDYFKSQLKDIEKTFE